MTLRNARCNDEDNFKRSFIINILKKRLSIFITLETSNLTVCDYILHKLNLKKTINSGKHSTKFTQLQKLKKIRC